MNPDGLNWYLNQNGIKTTPLGQGHLAGVPYESGGGFNAHYDSDMEQRMCNITLEVDIMVKERIIRCLLGNSFLILERLQEHKDLI